MQRSKEAVNGISPVGLREHRVNDANLGAVGSDKERVVLTT